MRLIPQAMADAWNAEVNVGNERRPVVRATIQRAKLMRFPYDCSTSEGEDFGHQRGRTGEFTSIVFGNEAPPVELRNVRKLSWDRSVDNDVAEATMTLLNSEISPIGNQEELEHSGDFDQPGYMSPFRGEARKSANRWGHEKDTGWNRLILPDRVVKTYEGYGCDITVPPEKDPNLVQTGFWLIDETQFDSDGNITITMRDIGRLLLDTIVFPPAVPHSEYPLSWEKIHISTEQGRVAKGGRWQTPVGSVSSSNEAYIGKGLTNPPFKQYVDRFGNVEGHRARHGLDDKETYWQSTGQPRSGANVWWQMNLNKATEVASVRVNPRAGRYRVYVSVKTADGWIGKKKIPYDRKKGAGDINNGSGIPFVKSELAYPQMPFDIELPRVYKRVKAIRLTFTRLYDIRAGREYPFVAMLQEFKIYAGSGLSFGRGEKRVTRGNYKDYSDIVKWACVWSGFYWPPHQTRQDFMQLDYEQNDEPRRTFTYNSEDRRLPKGRVWGNLYYAGTGGEADLTVDLFDKQPMMDMISYVRDILGFVFFIDEMGGVVWRMPNLFEVGNYITRPQDEVRWPSYNRTTEVISLDENTVLESWSVTHSSRNIRERLFVANTTGKIGTVIRAFTPINVGFRRVAGWTDQNFETKRETRVMADMISAQQMFDYRRGTARIKANPAIQIDDQVRIFERVTDETYYHYVESISSELDVEAGTWTYELGTHWLGERPSDAWVVRVDQLDGATKQYLNTIGADQ